MDCLRAIDIGNFEEKSVEIERKFGFMYRKDFTKSPVTMLVVNMCTEVCDLIVGARKLCENRRFKLR